MFDRQITQGVIIEIATAPDPARGVEPVQSVKGQADALARINLVCDVVQIVIAIIAIALSRA